MDGRIWGCSQLGKGWSCWVGSRRCKTEMHPPWPGRGPRLCAASIAGTSACPGGPWLSVPAGCCSCGSWVGTLGSLRAGRPQRVVGSLCGTHEQCAVQLLSCWSGRSTALRIGLVETYLPMVIWMSGPCCGTAGDSLSHSRVAVMWRVLSAVLLACETAARMLALAVSHIPTG